MKKTQFLVSGMSCSACSARVNKAALSVSGVADVNVNLLKNEMTVTYADAASEHADELVIEAVVKAGYGAELKNKPTSAACAAVRERPCRAPQNTSAHKSRGRIKFYLARRPL